MGLADRNYMRGGPSGTGVPATHAVLGVLVGFFILGLVAESSGTSFLRWMALPGARADAWQFLTYAFLHDGFWHLLGNGLLLWWVGPLVEAEQGRAGLVRVLMLGALVGALAWFATGLPGHQASLLVGASAAVLAAMVVGLDGREDESVTLLLFFFLPVTLRVRWLMLAIWSVTLASFVFSELPGRHAWEAWRPAWESPIAHSAHLGGLLLGAFLAWRARREGAVEPKLRIVVVESRAPSSRLPLSPEPGSPRSSSPHSSPSLPGPRSASSSPSPREELDGLLDKISAQGFGALSEAERRRLDELSQRLR